MNLDKLRALEKKFLKTYPQGFYDPRMQEIGKKHPIDKMHDLVAEMFEDRVLKKPNDFVEKLYKVITRSSMLSVFEKPKFRDWAKGLSTDNCIRLTQIYSELLLGDMEMAFNDLVDFYVPAQMAKWSIITIIPFYFAPKIEVFVKPNLTKDVIKYFDLDLEYKPRPDYAFYSKYKKIILEMTRSVAPSISINNAAFTGFLMMSFYHSQEESAS